MEGKGGAVEGGVGVRVLVDGGGLVGMMWGEELVGSVQGYRGE